MCIKNFRKSNKIVQTRYNKLEFCVQKRYVNNLAEGSRCVAQPGRHSLKAIRGHLLVLKTRCFFIIVFYRYLIAAIDSHGSGAMELPTSVTGQLPSLNYTCAGAGFFFTETFDLYELMTFETGELGSAIKSFLPRKVCP